jgi:ATP synthase protein I
MASRDENDPEARSADEAALAAKLRRLGERLDHAGAGQQPNPASAPRPTADTTAFARGFRLSTEIVAGVLFGAVVGWAIDHWLDSAPWGMIVCVLLGFVVGVLNLMRTAGLTRGADGRVE